MASSTAFVVDPCEPHRCGALKVAILSICVSRSHRCIPNFDSSQFAGESLRSFCRSLSQLLTSSHFRHSRFLRTQIDTASELGCHFSDKISLMCLKIATLYELFIFSFWEKDASRKTIFSLLYCKLNRF